MAIRSEKEMKKSRVTGIIWITLILAMSCVVALVGHEYLGSTLDEDHSPLVFINMVRDLFPAFLGGILLSAILAASMSTADSQLLASSSAFASDVYKKVIRKDAKDKEMLLVGRLKSVCASIGAGNLSVTAKSHEMAVKDGNISFVQKDNANFLAAYEKLLTDIDYYFKTQETSDEQKPELSTQQLRDVMREVATDIDEYDGEAAVGKLDNLLSSELRISNRLSCSCTGCSGS